MLISAMFATRGAVRGVHREVLTVVLPVAPSCTAGPDWKMKGSRFPRLQWTTTTNAYIEGVVFMATALTVIS